MSARDLIITTVAVYLLWISVVYITVYVAALAWRHGNKRRSI